MVVFPGFGVTWMEETGAADTVSSEVPVTVPLVAVMVVVPATRVVAMPVEAMVAVAGVPDVQVTVEVKSCVELSLNTPRAEKGSIAPATTVGFVGVTVIDFS